MSRQRGSALEGDLRANLDRLRLTSPVISTITSGKPNRIASVDATGVWIETAESRRKGNGPQLVDAWMLTTAWDYLRSNGTLSNRYLLAADGLNVKRSSAVCALLAHMPGVSVASSRPIVLRYRAPSE